MSQDGARPTAIIVAGGAARRLGGVLKPVVPVGGVRMIDRVLAAVAPHARQLIVVGPPELSLPHGIQRAQETPPGGGPVAALATALTPASPGDAALPSGAVVSGAGAPAPHAESPTTLILAGDLPLLTSTAVGALLAALPPADRADGVVYADHDGRPQWLCGAWHTRALRRRLADYLTARGGDAAGAPLRTLLEPLRITTLRSASDPPPWFDCDTPEDIRRAEEWLSR
jgi:molybdopterin-guanine dinucleotide biosynthesis protein A